MSDTSSSRSPNHFQDGFSAGLPYEEGRSHKRGGFLDRHLREIRRARKMPNCAFQYGNFAIEMSGFSPSLALNLFQDGFSISLPTEKGDSIPRASELCTSAVLPYDRSTASFLREIDGGWIPREISDALPLNYIDGCIVLELRDYRESTGAAVLKEAMQANVSGRSNKLGRIIEIRPKVHKLLLRPTTESVTRDIALLADDSWTYNDLLEIEARVLKAVQPPVCLDPSPLVAENAAILNYNKDMFNVQRRRAQWYKFGKVNAPQQQAGGGSEVRSKGGTNVPSKKQRHGKDSALALPDTSAQSCVSSIPSLFADNMGDDDSVLNMGGKGSRVNQFGTSGFPKGHPSSANGNANGFSPSGNGKGGGKGKPKPKGELPPDPQLVARPVMSDSAAQADSSQFLAPAPPPMSASLLILDASTSGVDSCMAGNGTETAAAAVAARADVKPVTHVETGKRPREAEAALRAEAKRQKQEQARLQKIQRDLQRAQMKQEKENQKRHQQQHKQLLRAQKQQAQSAVCNAPAPFSLPPPLPPTSSAQQPQPQMQNTASQTDAIMRVRKDGAVETTDMPLMSKLETRAVEPAHTIKKHAREMEEADQGLLTCIPNEHIGALDWQVPTQNDPARQKAALSGECPQLWQQPASEEVRNEPLPPLSSAQLLENRERSVLDAHLPGEKDATTLMEEPFSEKHDPDDLLLVLKMQADPKALRPDLALQQGCSGVFVSEDMMCTQQPPPAPIHEPVVGQVQDASVQHLVNPLGDMGGDVPSDQMKSELAPCYKGQHLLAVAEPLAQVPQPAAQHADAGTHGEHAGLTGSAACQVQLASDCQLPANDLSQLRSHSFKEQQQRQEQESQQLKRPFEVQGEAQASVFQVSQQQASSQSDCLSDKQLSAEKDSGRLQKQSDPNGKIMVPNPVCLELCNQDMDLQQPVLEEQQQPLLPTVEHSSCSDTACHSKPHTNLQPEQHPSEARDQGTRLPLPIRVKQEPLLPDAIQTVDQPPSMAHLVQLPMAPASLPQASEERPCSVNQGAEGGRESEDELPREPMVSAWSEKVPLKSQTQPLVQSSTLFSAHQPQTRQQQSQLQPQTFAIHQTQPLASPSFTTSQALLYPSPSPTSQVFSQSVSMSKTKQENSQMLPMHQSGTMGQVALTPIPQTPDQDMSNMKMHQPQTSLLGSSHPPLSNVCPPPPTVFSQPMHTVKPQAAFAAESTVKLEKDVKVERDVKMVKPVVKQEIDVKPEVLDVKVEKGIVVKVEQSVKKRQAALVGALHRSKSLKNDVKPSVSVPALSSPPPTCSSGVSTTSVGEAGVAPSIGSPRTCTVASPSISSTVVNHSHYGSPPAYTGHNWGTAAWGGTVMRTMSSSVVTACSPAGVGGQGMAIDSGIGLQSLEPPHQGQQSVEVQTESDDLGPIKAKFVKLIQFIHKHIPKKPPKKGEVRKTGPAQPSWQLLQFALASNIDEGKELLASQKGLVGFGGSVNVPRLRTIRFQAPHLLHIVRLTFCCASNKDPVEAILFMEDRDQVQGYVDRIHFDLPTFRSPFAADRFASQYTALMIKDNYILVEDVIRMQGTSGITSNQTGFQAGTGTPMGISNAAVPNGAMGIAIGAMRVQGNPLASAAGVIANGHVQPGMGVLPGALASSQRMPPPGTPRQLMQAHVGMPTVGAIGTLAQSDAVQQQHHHHLLQQQQYAQQLQMQNHQMQRAQVISAQGYNSPIQLASPYTAAVQGSAQLASNQILTSHGGQPQIQQMSTLQHFQHLHHQQQQQGKPYETAQQQLMLRRRAVGSGTSSLSNVAAVPNLSGYTSVPGVATGISGVGIPVASSGNMGGMPAIGSMSMMNGMGSVGGIPSMSGMTPVTGVNGMPVLTGTLTPMTGVPAMGTAVPGVGTAPVGVASNMRQPPGGTTGNQGASTKRGSSQSRSRGSPNGGLGSPPLSGDSSAPARSAPNAGAASPSVIMTQAIGSTAATTLQVSRGNSVGPRVATKGIPGQVGMTVQGTVQRTTVHGSVAAGYAYAIPQMGTMMGTVVIQPHPTVAPGTPTPYQGVPVRSRGGRQTPAPTPPAT